jgi:hypothetical protein
MDLRTQCEHSPHSQSMRWYHKSRLVSTLAAGRKSLLASKDKDRGQLSYCILEQLLLPTYVWVLRLLC